MKSSEKVKDEDVWLVDSGCINYLTKEVNNFIRLDRSIKVLIKVWNGEVVLIIGKGNISIMINKGKRVMKDVFLVYGLVKKFL